MNSRLFHNGIWLLILSWAFGHSVFAMGIRSLVALPVEKGGAVVRLAVNQQTDSTQLTTSAAYGINPRQTLLMALPYRLSPSGKDRQGDVSILYRYIIWQRDHFQGTDRLGVLAGVSVPEQTNSDGAWQAGLVFSRFMNRHEIDLNALYQTGMGNRADSGRYDFSWQYRLLPKQHADWGISDELFSVVELNGRWQPLNGMTRQITLGLQWVKPTWVLEAAMVRNINHHQPDQYIVSTRFHF